MMTRYGDLTSDAGAIVEALNFSVQTVTTVRYGNWASGLPDQHPTVILDAVLGRTAPALGGRY